MGEPKDQLIAELLLYLVPPAPPPVTLEVPHAKSLLQIAPISMDIDWGPGDENTAWSSPHLMGNCNYRTVRRSDIQTMSWCSWSTSPFRDSHIKSAHFTSQSKLFLTVTTDYCCLKIKLFSLYFIHYPQIWRLQTVNVIGNSLDNVQGKIEAACCSTAQLDLEQWQQL